MHAHHIELARHALGLDGQRKQSYRNYFVAGQGHPDHSNWMEMVSGNDATWTSGTKLQFGGDDLFRLTKQGATKALRPGERLDREDF